MSKTNKKEIPETMGAVCAVVYIMVIICFIPFPFYKDIVEATSGGGNRDVVKEIHMVETGRLLHRFPHSKVRTILFWAGHVLERNGKSKSFGYRIVGGCVYSSPSSRDLGEHHFHPRHQIKPVHNYIFSTSPLNILPFLVLGKNVGRFDLRLNQYVKLFALEVTFR